MGEPDAALAPEDLLPFVTALECRGTLHIGFSGGLDSTALLLALAQLRPKLASPLNAIHVNHGAHPAAAAWAEHCQGVCDLLDLPLTLVAPPAHPLPKDSPEAQWRQWRLQAFEDLLGEQDVVCTAHHRQDQAESLLLALLRSSGPQGLAAMPNVRPLGKGRLARPFLHLSRAALRHFVEQQGVAFIEDPGNHDTGFDRNYLRHEVMPVLAQRWPAAEQSLATSAGLFAQLSTLLADEGAVALAGREPCPGVLDLGGLTEQSETLALVIRQWLRRRGARPLPRARMDDLVQQLGFAGQDNRIYFKWQDQHLFHTQNRLWLLDTVPVACASTGAWNNGTIDCGLHSGLLLIEPADLARHLRVAPRKGGEHYRQLPDTPRRTLKKWFNDYRLPPWYRDCVPLLLEGDRLLAVGDVILDRDLEARLVQQGGALRWKPVDRQLEWAWQECRRRWLQVE